MNTITLRRDTVEQARKALANLLFAYSSHMRSEFGYPGRPWTPERDNDEAALQAQEALAALQQAEPQAQAGHLHLKSPFEDENGNDISGEYITLQAHREAMEANTRLWAAQNGRLRAAIDKKDAALKDCVEAAAKAIYSQWKDRVGYVPWIEAGNSIMQDDARAIARAAITQAQGAMK